MAQRNIGSVLYGLSQLRPVSHVGVVARRAALCHTCYVSSKATAQADVSHEQEPLQQGNALDATTGIKRRVTSKPKDPDALVTERFVRDQASKPREKAIKNAITLTYSRWTRELSPIKLRDSCTCPRCQDPSTRQKLISTWDIPSNIQARSVERSETGACSIRWRNDIPGFEDDHVTVFNPKTVRSLLQRGTTALPAPLPRPHLWEAAALVESVGDLDYGEYINNDATVYRVVSHLQKYGFAYLTGVPEDEESVARIAERIGPLKTTFYGRTWDVRSVPEAKNVAYTSQDLGFHMDLLYMEQPPHLQLLHCIRSSSVGGASLFTDSYRALQLLAKEDPEAFMTLQRTQIAFHYDHPEHQYRQSRSVLEAGGQEELRRLRRAGREAGGSAHKQLLEEAARGEIKANVFWSPPFQAPLGVHDGWVEEWHRAAGVLNRLFHRKEAVHERLMKPGECVIFDNRRVLHARGAFEVADQGQERWLRGAYVDWDPFASRLRTLRERFGKSGKGEEPEKEGEEAGKEGEEPVD